MLHLYAVIDRPQVAAPEIRGVDGGAPRFIAHDGVAFAVGQRDDGQAATLAAIDRHEAVVEALMADRAVLPARFGSSLPDKDTAQDLLGRRHGEIIAGLGRVRGCVEIGLHMAWRGAGGSRQAAARGGRATHTASDAHAGRIQAKLAQYARQSKRMAVGIDDQVADLAFLVATDWLPMMLAKARALRQECADAVMVCTGPWPPYSFVDLDLSDRPPSHISSAGGDR